MYSKICVFPSQRSVQFHTRVALESELLYSAIPCKTLHTRGAVYHQHQEQNRDIDHTNNTKKKNTKKQGPVL